MSEETMEEEGEAPPAGGKKKLIIIAAVGLVLLLGGGGAGAAWFLGFLGGDPEAEEMAEGEIEESEPEPEPREIVFVDMPEVLVNLHSLGQRTRFLKLRVALEVDGEPVAEEVKTLMPRVMDSFQAYLRALTVDEVSGPGGLQRLKEELTARVNLALEPTRVDDVLIKEMLVQ